MGMGMGMGMFSILVSKGKVPYGMEVYECVRFFLRRMHCMDSLVFNLFIKKKIYLYQYFKR